MEQLDIDKWIKESINSERADDYLFSLYLSSTSNKTDVKRGFRIFAENTGLKRKKNGYALTFSSIAVALVSIAYAVWLSIFSAPTITDWTSVSTLPGEGRDLQLCDGTNIHLGPCSNVFFPSAFNGSERKIFALGDVYLDVAHDETHPFVVSLSGMDVKVHGTKFHLYSFPGVDDQEIALAQGSVSVSIGDGGDTILLTPGEILKYNKGKKTYRKSQFDADAFNGQMSGKQILFDNESLAEIARKLSNRFGANVVVCDDSLLEQTYYASFINGEDLPEILKILSEKGGFSIKHYNNHYLIIK